MVWTAAEVALAVIGLTVLAVLGVRLWRQVRVLTREVGAAAERLGAATAALDEASAGSRSPAPPLGGGTSA